jgi:hypothetical protein
MLLLTMLFAGLAHAQCVKQPAVALKAVDEFACRGMSYEQAWDTLTAGGVAPVRPIRVAEMSMKTNYNSRKQLVSRGLRIVGFATGIVAAYFGQDLKGWQIGALAAGPSVVDQGVKWVAGEPDAFTQLPDDNGFTTIYALATNQQIVGPKLAFSRPTVRNPNQLKTLDKSADSNDSKPVQRPTHFTPANWYVLYGESNPDHIARVHDGLRRSFMNAAERGAMESIEDFRLVAAK